MNKHMLIYYNLKTHTHTHRHTHQSVVPFHTLHMWSFWVFRQQRCCRCCSVCCASSRRSSRCSGRGSPSLSGPAALADVPCAGTEVWAACRSLPRPALRSPAARVCGAPTERPGPAGWRTSVRPAAPTAGTQSPGSSDSRASRRWARPRPGGGPAVSPPCSPTSAAAASSPSPLSRIFRSFPCTEQLRSRKKCPWNWLSTTPSSSSAPSLGGRSWRAAAGSCRGSGSRARAASSPLTAPPRSPSAPSSWTWSGLWRRPGSWEPRTVRSSRRTSPSPERQNLPSCCCCCCCCCFVCSGAELGVSNSRCCPTRSSSCPASFHSPELPAEKTGGHISLISTLLSQCHGFAFKWPSPLQQ